MKKMFFFALAAAGMLTACSNEDTLGGNGEQNVSEQQIRLGVASSKVQTRGTGTVGGMISGCTCSRRVAWILLTTSLRLLVLQ